MHAAGVLLIVLGVAVAALSFGAGVLGLGIGGPAGGFLILVGAVLMAGGSITGAIEDQTKVLAAELRTQSENYKAGVEAMWKQMDAVRQNTVAAAPAPTPLERAIAAVPEPTAPPPVMGHCQGCGKLRAANVTKCVYCGDVAPIRT